MSGKTSRKGSVVVEPARRGRPPVPRAPRGGNVKPVQIVIDGPDAIVVNAPLGLLTSELTTRHRGYRPGGSRGLEAVEIAEKHFRTEAPGRVRIPVGLAARVAILLQKTGYRVEILNVTPPRDRIRLDLARLSGEAPEAEAFARAIAIPRRGLIVAPRRNRPALIAAMMNAFPKAWITVVVATRLEAEKMRRQLGPLVGEPVLVFTRQFIGSDRRLRICTLGSVDERAADILVFTEAAQTLHVPVAYLFELLGNQHVYGFTPTTSGWGRRSQIVIEGRLGLVIYKAPEAASRVGVTVVVADTPWTPPLVGGIVRLERKRRSIWHADRRNDVVAQIALALVRGDRVALGEHGLLLDEGANPLDDPARPPRVAVLVESPEHARELALRLPDWPVRTGGPELSAGEASGMGPSIMTLVHAQGRKRLNLDVLVRADGGSGALGLPGFPPRHRDAEGGMVVLVDFDDDFDREADLATRGRLRAYEGQQWLVVAPPRRGGRR